MFIGFFYIGLFACCCFPFIIQVQLEHDSISEYIIRTQPNSKSLCTIEAIALSLSVLENDNEIAEVSVGPCLCRLSKPQLVKESLFFDF